MVADDSKPSSFVRGLLVAIFFGLCFWVGLTIGYL